MANILRAAVISVHWDAAEYEQGDAGVTSEAIVPERRLEAGGVDSWLRDVYGLEVASWQDTGERVTLDVPPLPGQGFNSLTSDPERLDFDPSRKVLDNWRKHAVTVGWFGRVKPDPRYRSGH